MVAVSIPPQEWLVRRIAGAEVEVVTLVSPADDPHTYQPTDAQVSRVMHAGVYFRIGVPFERGGWFEALRDSGAVPIVDVRQGLTLIDMRPHEHAEEHETGDEDAHAHEQHARAHGGAADDSESQGKDPHVWLTPRLLKAQAENMTAAMSKLRPRRQAEFERNLARLRDELDRLDASIRQELAPCGVRRSSSSIRPGVTSPRNTGLSRWLSRWKARNRPIAS